MDSSISIAQASHIASPRSPNLARTDDFGRTRLMSAVRQGHGEIVEGLLNASAEVNAKDHDGKTALMWAPQQGGSEIIGALLRAGANTEEADRTGATALMWAAREGIARSSWRS